MSRGRDVETLIKALYERDRRIEELEKAAKGVVEGYYGQGSLRVRMEVLENLLPGSKDDE